MMRPTESQARRLAVILADLKRREAPAATAEAPQMTVTVAVQAGGRYVS